MFPKWSDWHIQYTTKGLIKQRLWQTLRVVALLGAIAGLYRVRNDVRGGLRALDGAVKERVKFGLLRLLGWVERGVRMLPERSRVL